jgi:hypothetical protein
LAAVILTLAGCDQDRVAGAGDAGRPACTSVAGTGAVTFTTDEGASLAPTAGVLTGVKYTRGLVALSGSTLLAAHAGTLLRSTDAGCSWTWAGTVPHSYVALVAASPTLAYGYPEGSAGLYHVGADGAVQNLASPVQRVWGLAVRAGRPENLRVAGETGQIYESDDGGATWRSVGVPVPATLLYSVAFDPANWDHAVAGAANSGAWTTEDGGRSWSRAQIASSTTQRNQNVFRLAVSPVDPDVVWAAGIDLAEEDRRSRSGRHAYLSRDRGRTFIPVLSESAESPSGGPVTIVNGFVMEPHPRDPLVLYFVFSASTGNYGTDIVRLDARSGTHSVRHNPYHDVSEITFAPGRPDVMYLGLGVEQRCDPIACAGTVF